MEKKNARRALAGALVTAALLGSAAAVTAVTTKQLNANFMGIKLVVDGVPTTPKDPNGNVVEPFACEGTTYLPVRAVAEALGKEVKWDGETRTVYIGDNIPGKETNWMKKLAPYDVGYYDRIYDGTNLSKSFTVQGIKHTGGIAMKDDDHDGSASYVIWNPNGMYKSMTFTVGRIDDTSQYDAPLDIYVDGELQESHPVKWDEAAKTITVDLNYALTVKFVLNADNRLDTQGRYANYGIYDISFAE